MSLKGLIEPVQFTQLLADPDYEAVLAGPKEFIGNGCVYFAYQKPEGLARYNNQWSRAWMTFSLQLDGDDEYGYRYELEFECTLPHPESWVAWVTQDGSRDLLSWAGLSSGEDDAERFMMENGIAPGQKFMAEILFYTSRDYWGEYDEHIEGRIMSIESWTTEQILAAWGEHFKIMLGGPHTFRCPHNDKPTDGCEVSCPKCSHRCDEHPMGFCTKCKCDQGDGDGN